MDVNKQSIDDKDAARAAAKLSGENIGALIVSLWNEAHADYSKLYRSFDRDDEIIAAHAEWNAWRARRPPGPTSEAAHVLAVRVRRHYAEALIKRAENQAARQIALTANRNQVAAEGDAAEAKITWANATLAPLWTVGVQLSVLAAKVASTRPASPYMEVPSMANAPKIRRPANELIAPVADDAALLAVLDTLDGDVSEITKAIKAIRVAIAARAKAA